MTQIIDSREIADLIKKNDNLFYRNVKRNEKTFLLCLKHRNYRALLAHNISGYNRKDPKFAVMAALHEFSEGLIYLHRMGFAFNEEALEYLLLHEMYGMAKWAIVYWNCRIAPEHYRVIADNDNVDMLKFMLSVKDLNLKHYFVNSPKCAEIYN